MSKYTIQHLQDMARKIIFIHDGAGVLKKLLENYGAKSLSGQTPTLQQKYWDEVGDIMSKLT